MTETLLNQGGDDPLQDVKALVANWMKCLSDMQQALEENEQLRKRLEQVEEEQKALQEQLQGRQEDYDSLMTAKMLQVSEGDMEAAKARLAKLVRSVNRCITLLSEK